MVYTKLDRLIKRFDRDIAGISKMVERIKRENNKISKAIVPTFNSFDTLADKYPELEQLVIVSTISKHTVKNFINETNIELDKVIDTLENIRDSLLKLKDDKKDVGKESGTDKAESSKED